MDLKEYQSICPNTQAEGLTWILPNEHCAWRVQTLRTKEEDTWNWLHGMQAGEVLFDVGSNMGQYSLLAAKRGVKVHAFEPEGQNFALMVRNIAINQLGELITPWPVALSNQPGIEILHMSTLVAGGSCHAFGENINFNGEKKTFPYKQGAIATTLDIFCEQYGYPDYIKIDVDGFEHKVIEGGFKTLTQAKSVLVEINTHYDAHMNFILPRMKNYGFGYDPVLADLSRRKEGPFTGVGNVIFHKQRAISHEPARSEPSLLQDSQR